ncbi:putative MATE family efflux protein [Kordia periserrulae]|uniref:Multidrug export protein MepA n=1 Tax=Kordia periserrulae TaxID=701523 RepID=A0A2T6C783_9FLAO|nr:MATE family efflux transporter [Kordia periserrulae]PTX64180.1 putative MATE family efflux protein [Kordia periserrulae]
MAINKSAALGTEPIGKLLIAQAVPASIGILVMSLNMVVDTIFVGQWIGPMAIAAITVVVPLTFLIASIGMAIGVGGASIISRALGKDDQDKAQRTFGNMIVMSLGLAVFFVVVGLVFKEEGLALFGANGDIYSPAEIYYVIVMYGIPFLALCMTGNPVVRAEGKPKFAMVALILPAIGNIFFDYLFINVLDMGMAGAAWATSISYFICFLFIYWFFISKYSELKIKLRCFKLEHAIVREITELGGVTLARQGMVSILSIVLNHTLFAYGGETSVTIYGIISRMLMFALFPVMGISQGFLPIAGYNYGAEKLARVRESINISIKYGTGLALLIFAVIMIFPEQITFIFTKDETVIRETPNALRWVFLVTPLIAVQMIGAGYFQAIGKAIPALLLTLTKQGFFLIPLVLILPTYFGIFGVWVSFPIADVLATLVTGWYLNREVKRTLR